MVARRASQDCICRKYLNLLAEMDTCLAALQLMVYYRYLPTFKTVTPPAVVTATAEGRGDIPVDTNL